MIEIGDILPEFNLDDTLGNGFSSKNKILGKKCILYFYPNDFNPGCTIEAEEFSKFFEEFKMNKIEIVGISDDDPDSHQEFCESIKIPYTLLSDTEHIVSELFGVTEMKNFLGNDVLAIKRSTFLINQEGKIFKIFRDVEPEGHAKNVLEEFLNN